MKTLVKVIIVATLCCGGGFYAYQSTNAVELDGNVVTSFSDVRSFRGVKQSDDTVNATVAIKLKYPARFTPYALVGGGWQNTGFVTEGVKSIVTVAFGISGDAGPVGLFVELRGIAFNEDLTGQGVDASNESVNVGFRVKSF